MNLEIRTSYNGMPGSLPYLQTNTSMSFRGVGGHKRIPKGDLGGPSGCPTMLQKEMPDGNTEDHRVMFDSDTGGNAE